MKYNYGTVLENKLNNTRILKCGVPGFSLKQKFLKTTNIIKKLEKKPKLIIFVYSFPTDLRGDYLFPQYKVENNILTTNKVISSFETGEIQLRKDNKKTLSKIFYIFMIIDRKSILSQDFYSRERLINRVIMCYRYLPVCNCKQLLTSL